MGAVVAFKRDVERRMVRLASPQDQVVNNTDGELHLRDVKGALIELLRPGHVYQSDTPIEVYFDSNAAMAFRSYVNQETPHDHVY